MTQIIHIGSDLTEVMPRLKAYREFQKMSREEVAQLMGRAYGTVRALEVLDVPQPRLSLLLEYLNAIGAEVTFTVHLPDLRER